MISNLKKIALIKEHFNLSKYDIKDMLLVDNEEHSHAYLIDNEINVLCKLVKEGDFYDRRGELQVVFENYAKYINFYDWIRYKYKSQVERFNTLDWCKYMYIDLTNPVKSWNERIHSEPKKYHKFDVSKVFGSEYKVKIKRENKVEKYPELLIKNNEEHSLTTTYIQDAILKEYNPVSKLGCIKELKRCTCGSKYTAFPNHHLTYCEAREW